MTLVSVNLKPVLSGMTTLSSAMTLIAMAEASKAKNNFFIRLSLLLIKVNYNSEIITCKCTHYF